MERMVHEERKLGFFERYLTVWASLATVVGVLIEVLVMPMLVKVCLRTKGWFV